MKYCRRLRKAEKVNYSPILSSGNFQITNRWFCAPATLINYDVVLLIYCTIFGQFGRGNLKPGADLLTCTRHDSFCVKQKLSTTKPYAVSHMHYCAHGASPTQ